MLSIPINEHPYLFLLVTCLAWIHFVAKHSTNDSSIIGWKTPDGDSSPVSVQAKLQSSFTAIWAIDQTCTAMYTVIYRKHNDKTNLKEVIKICRTKLAHVHNNYLMYIMVDSNDQYTCVLWFKWILECFSSNLSPQHHCCSIGFLA